MAVRIKPSWSLRACVVFVVIAGIASKPGADYFPTIAPFFVMIFGVMAAIAAGLTIHLEKEETPHPSRLDIVMTWVMWTIVVGELGAALVAFLGWYLLAVG
jgi:hypothetical protein